MPTHVLGPAIGEAVRKSWQLIAPKLQELNKENADLKERLERVEKDVLILRELVYKTKQQ